MQIMKIEKSARVFISYAHTGQKKEEVEERIKLISEELSRAGISFYCNLYDPIIETFKSPGEYIKDAAARLKECNTAIVLKASEHRSEGQLIEVGVAMAMGIPVFLLIHESAIGHTYLNDPLIATKTVIWSTKETLSIAIKNILE